MDYTQPELIPLDSFPRTEPTERPKEPADYAEWVAKLDAPKTTDDCFTPPLVYDAVLRWTVEEFGLHSARIMRPFHPGGDYMSEDYSGDCVVIDNPPFSILAEITRFYLRYGIRYMLFAPSLTAFTTIPDCAVITGSDIIYHNGVIVRTAFRTNMDTAVARSAPELSAAVKAACEATQKAKKAKKAKAKPLPKYEYPAEAVTAAYLLKLAGVPYRIERSDAHGRIEGLDHQREHGKSMFGGGYLVSRQKAAELRAAELRAAELRAAELRAARRGDIGERIEWVLSERERRIVDALG